MIVELLGDSNESKNEGKMGPHLLLRHTDSEMERQERGPSWTEGVQGARVAVGHCDPTGPFRWEVLDQRTAKVGQVAPLALV